MKVGLIGPGAIGCVVASALVGRDDVEVMIGARTPFDELRVTGIAQPVIASVSVETSPSDGAPLDVVLLATKAHQTPAAQPFLDAWCGPSTVVVVLQNGVDHVERTQPFVPDSTVVPVVVACPASRSAPGVSHLGGRCQLIVPDSDAARSVGELFDGSHVDWSAVSDWKTASWFKLLTNCCNGAITTLARSGNAVLRDPAGRALTLAMMREVATVARAEGADLPDDAIEPFLDVVLERASDHVSSIVVDRLAGQPTEWEARNHVVVRLAARHGIDVPLVAATTTLLRLGEPG